MKNRWISFLLVLAMLLTLVSLSAFAEGYKDPETMPNGVTITNPETASTLRRDLSLDKTLTTNDDGTYNIQLETYATGEVTTKVVTNQVPTDFVLVVDQSGSMSTNDMPTKYVPATTPSGGWKIQDLDSNQVDDIGNAVDKEYYYRDPATGDYYRVYRKWGDMYQYVHRNTVYCKDIVDRNNLTWFASNKVTAQDVTSTYYYQPSSDQNVDLPTSQYSCRTPIQSGGASDHNFYPVSITSQGKDLYYAIRLKYTDINGYSHWLRWINNPTNSVENKDWETGNCIWYRDPSGNHFGPGDTYGVIFAYSGATIRPNCNDMVVGWIDKEDDYDSFYTYGQITSALQAGMYVQNPLFIRHVGYNSLAYRDANGEEHYLIQTDYCNEDGVAVKNKNDTTVASYDGVLYQANDSSKQSRVDALKGALNEFVKNVAGQTDDVHGTVPHRIALVGFSSDGYNNTEIFTNTMSGFSLNTVSHNGVQKNTADSNKDYYKYALVPAHSEEESDSDGVNDALPAGIAQLTANGGTQPEDGLDMAYEILTRNDKAAEYNQTDENGNAVRNAVVIYFTDGRPGNYGYVDQYSEANQVVSSARNIKRDVSGAQVYSIGVFGEADGNPLTYTKTDYVIDMSSVDHWTESRDVPYFTGTYADAKQGANYDGLSYDPTYVRLDNTDLATRSVSFMWYGKSGAFSSNEWRSASARVPVRSARVYHREALRFNDGYPAQQNDTIADYMTVVSSTYPKAESFDGGWSTNPNGTYNTVVNNARQEHEKISKNYYMLCTDTTRLNEVFVNIAEDVSTAGTSVNLDENAVLKDIVNTDVFKAPAAGDVEAYSVGYTANETDGQITYTEGSRTDETYDVSVSDGTVRVSGFDYEHHYVMPNQTDPDVVGQKLVVVIKNLELKKMGSELESNDGAGIYAVDENTGDESTEPVLNIASPILDTADAYFAVQKVKVVQTSDGRGLEEDGDKTLYLKSDYTQNHKFNITEKVSDGFLYGGTFEKFNNGTLSNAYTFGNDSGLGFVPNANTTYYLKEVPNTYLFTKNLYRGSGPNLVRAYLITAVDSDDYYQTGFELNGKDAYRDDRKVFNHVILTDGPIAGSGATGNTTAIYVSDVKDIIVKPNANGDYELNDIKIDEDGTLATVIVKAKDVVPAFSGSSGYLSIYPFEINDSVQSATAYWVTHDGVKVTGTNLRKVKNGRKDGKDDTLDSNCTLFGEGEYKDNLTVQSMFVGADDIDEEELVDPVDDGINLAGYTASLNGNIAMNFYLELSEEVAADKDAYMQFKLPGTNHTEEVVALKDAQKVNMGGKTYYVFSAGIAAKDMTSNIQAQFVKGDKTTSEEWNYTIKEYCDYIRNHPDAYDVESVALAEAMLNYGGYTQKYFNHNVKNLANEGLNVALPEVEPDDSFNPEESGACEGLTYLGTSAMLTTVTALNHYFEFKGDPSDYTFTANGKELKVETDSNGSYVQIAGVKAKDLDKPITLTVKDKAGNTYTLNYSVYTNVMQVVAGEFPDNAKNMMKALYGYGEAAKAYFASRK